MDEENQEQTQEQSNDGGNTSQELDPIERANLAAERLEKANKEQRSLLDESKDLEAKRILGGRTTGQQTENTKDESPLEYSRRVIQGNL